MLICMARSNFPNIFKWQTLKGLFLSLKTTEANVILLTRYDLPNSQGHNFYKLKYISLEEVKIVSFQQ